MNSGKTLAEIEKIVLESVTGSLRLGSGVATLNSQFDRDLHCGSVDFVDILNRLERQLQITLMKQSVFDLIVPVFNSGFQIEDLAKIVFAEIE